MTPGMVALEYMDNDANTTYLRLLESVSEGEKASPRGMDITEVLGFQSVVDMRRPVVFNPLRKLNPRFLFGEAWWILSGSNRVGPIAQFMGAIRKFSDDGIMFSGAYGPPLMMQMRYIVDSLVKDLDTRQAVSTIWVPNPRESKDIPCTIAVQFLVRDGKLHCIDTMRSSDCWLGWPYDVFNFSMISAYVALRLRQRGFDVQLGELTLTAGSQHIYSRDSEKVQEVLLSNHIPYGLPLIDLSDFESAEDLVEKLHDAATLEVDVAYAERLSHDQERRVTALPTSFYTIKRYLSQNVKAR